MALQRFPLYGADTRVPIGNCCSIFRSSMDSEAVSTTTLATVAEEELIRALSFNFNFNFFVLIPPVPLWIEARVRGEGEG